MSPWRRAVDATHQNDVVMSLKRNALVFPLLVLACIQSLADAAVLSEQIDSEIAELHAAMDEGFQHIANLTAQLQAVGGITARGTLGSAGPALAALPASGGASPSGVTTPLGSEKVAKLRKLEADFAAIQAQAFQIGRESADNSELAKHPQVNNYVQSLRELRPRVKDMVSDLEKELQRITGRQVEKPKKQKKTKKIKGLSEQDIVANAKAMVERDSRDFRTKAMDFVSTFRERQMQMQDKQQDLQREMDGPDWPKEDWPLSSSDAKVVGDSEAIITSAQQELVKKMDPLGGLPRVHESGDESVLVQLAALSEMMSGYCELIEQYVEAVKKVNRGKKKPKKQKATKTTGTNSQLPPLTVNPLPPAGAPPSGGSLRENLLNFGGQQRKPFDWLGGGLDAGASSTLGGPSLGSQSFQSQSSNVPLAGNSFSQGSPDQELHRFQRENLLQQHSDSSSTAFAKFANLGSTLGNLANGFAKDSAGGAMGTGAFGAQHLPPRPRAFSAMMGEL